MFDIRQDDLEGKAVRELLAFHLASARALTPAEFSFALDLSQLKAPEISVWTAWDRDVLAGVAALKILNRSEGEVKSMRTAPAFLCRGVGGALLDHIVGEARGRGLGRLSLETGTGPAYQPALALYRKRGFVDGGPFADYRPSPFNRFLHLTL